ncbi:tyrosine-type recombinase/integrase [Desulfovulcanus sp.]
MGSKFYSTKYPGVEYREHPTRKHGPKPDRYYTIRYYRNKKRVREALGWASEGWSPSKVYKILCEIKANIKTGKGPQSLAEMREIASKQRQEKELDQARQMLFKDVADIYIEEYAKSNKKSWKDDKSRLKHHLLPVLGDKPINQISYKDIESLKRTCQNKKLATATVGQCLALARQIINFASKRGWFVGKNPVSQVKFPRTNNRRVRFLSEAEEKEFFAVAKKIDIDVHDICMVSLYSGMRMGEIFGLAKMDVDLQAGKIFVRDPKGGTDRVLPLHEKLVPIFSARIALAQGPEALLFPNSKGGEKYSIGKKFYKVMKKLGWNKNIEDRRLRVCAHSFRHTFGSRLVKKGIPLPVVQKLMGHADISMTLRYVHVEDEQCAHAIATL